jgi:hypothetical protein
MCFATIMKWWPCAPSTGEPSTDDVAPPAVGEQVEVAVPPAALLTKGAPVGPTVNAAQPYLRELSEEPVLLDDAEPGQSSARGPAPTVTDRWFHTTDGVKVPALMRLTHTEVSRPRNGTQPQDQRPSIKIGVLIGCQQNETSLSGSALRARLVSFLNSATIRELVDSLTHVAPGATWVSLAGHGTLTLEAVLTSSGNPIDGDPVASALFLPPTQEALYGRVERTATLILYLEPQTPEGHVPPASGLVAWQRNLRRALAAPAAFAEFLSRDVGLTTVDAPPAQFGVWMESHQAMTVMVSTEGVRTLPGSSPSSQFTGWAYADADGKPAGELARELMVQMCEYTLHLDDFESALPENLS